jgi:hypothetical protein
MLPRKALPNSVTAITRIAITASQATDHAVPVMPSNSQVASRIVEVGPANCPSDGRMCEECALVSARIMHTIAVA